MDTNSYAGYAPEIVMAKAAEVCGGPGNLAYVLQSSIDDVCRWISGDVPTPDMILREALTVVTCIRK